jgi:hypothetical protein
MRLDEAFLMKPGREPQSWSGTEPEADVPQLRAAEGPGRSTAAELRHLSIDALESALLELACELAAHMSRYLDVLAELDRREAWRRAGCRNLAEWLAWRAGIALGTAREQVRVAVALSRLPNLHDALRRGEISYSKARALTRVATPANEAELLALARRATGAQLERICASYR